jgi:hypothetical protein
MAVRDSKLALGEAAAFLGQDRKAARNFLRQVQSVAKRPIPYRTIVEAMRQCQSDDLRAIACFAADLLEDEKRAVEAKRVGQ